MILRPSFLILSFVLASAACAAPASPGPGTDPDTTPKKPTKETPEKAGTTTTPEKSTTPPEAPEPGEQEADLKDFLLPQKINTGFTGGAEVFKVPVFTDLQGTLKWEVADPTIATVAQIAAPSDYTPTEGKPTLTFAMITSAKAGATKVTVSAGGKTAEAQITVKTYTSAAFEVGKTRYKTGGTEANRKACASCHEAAGGADHSPSWLAYFEDEDVLTAVQTAVYASDKYEVNQGNHKWNLTDAEKPGIIAFLRGLPPKNFQ